MIHIGIIGGGNISDTHARAAREIGGVKIAAIYGRNREKTARLAQAYSGTRQPMISSSKAHSLDVGVCGQ
jgi:predicted dehydrogenase